VFDDTTIARGGRLLSRRHARNYQKADAKGQRRLNRKL